MLPTGLRGAYVCRLVASRERRRVSCDCLRGLSNEKSLSKGRRGQLGDQKRIQLHMMPVQQFVGPWPGVLIMLPLANGWPIIGMTGPLPNGWIIVGAPPG
jgi:hypothetical protein